ncbi:MAG: carbohydrate kinase family protein [Chitinophagaceae bacterium]|nr:MAG: carbohydrate kinase family protein [Chitinophagaceae bacterium]
MKKRFDVIVVGELNVDIILNGIRSFPEIGKEKFCNDMTLTLGSSAAILASNLSALGKKVSFVGKIGNDMFGHFCKNQLQTKGVDTSLLCMSETVKTGATVVLNYDEDRANVTYQGAMQELTAEEVTKEMLSTAKHLHFSSYFFQPGFKNKLPQLFKIAKEIGLTTSFDIQWDPNEVWDIDLNSIVPYVDILLPNETELLHITRSPNLRKALSILAKQKNITVVKRGNKGSLLVHDNLTIIGQPFVNETVVDCIGAGDSFNAGFLFKFLNQESLESCQDFANLMGAVSTTQAGGTAAFTNYEETLQIAKEKFEYEPCDNVAG